MTRTLPFVHRGCDLDTVEEVEELVVRFYREVAQDDVLGRYFVDIAHVDWYAHVGKLTDFWRGVLLDEAHEPIPLTPAHRRLHDAEPFRDEVFDRWLEIFTTTVEGGWSGPNADRALRRARGFLWAIAARTVGSGGWRPPPR